MSALQSSRLVPLHYQRDFHPRLADLNRLLRYSLGESRPTQTAHQALSPARLTGGVRQYPLEDGYFTDGSIPTKIGTSTPPRYATHPTHTANAKLQ
jgi:hypothetical protein